MDDLKTIKEQLAAQAVNDNQPGFLARQKEYVVEVGNDEKAMATFKEAGRGAAAMTGVGVVIDGVLMCFGAPFGLATMLGGYIGGISGTIIGISGIIAGGVEAVNSVSGRRKKHNRKADFLKARHDWINAAGQMLNSSGADKRFLKRVQGQVATLANDNTMSQGDKEARIAQKIKEVRELIEDITIISAGNRGASDSEVDFLVPVKEEKTEIKAVKVQVDKSYVVGRKPANAGPSKLGY